MAGISRRMARVFNPDGRSLIVAYDHGQGGANYGGMADPGTTLPELIAAGADAVLTTVGVARHFERLLARTGLIVSLDRAAGDEEEFVRELVLLGAEMGKIVLTPWNPDQPDSPNRVRRLATVCHAWDLPLMVEPIPVNFQSTENHTPAKVGQAAKMACELGGDLIKMHYTGDPGSFRQATAPVYQPVVILGGPKRPDETAVLRDVYDAMSAGAVGVAIGRNIWAHERPARMVAALAAVVHGGLAPEQAARELQTAV